MIYIEKDNTDPFFNIAAEEYLLKHHNEEILMLWQSEPSVIVGKHQNTITEVNQRYADENNIPVIRRISGGGTVYHDKGNINYTLITTESSRDRLIDFRKFTLPVIQFLKQHDIHASFEGKNNLTVNGKKFSGNSAHVFKNRVMHHGTILYSTDLDKLEKVIRPEKFNIEDKAVQSIRANVVNLNEYFPKELKVLKFKLLLQKYLFKQLSINSIEYIPTDNMSAISSLISDKYKQWDWNFGYSPKYIFKNSIEGIDAQIQVKNGIIFDAKIDSANAHESMQIESQIIGSKHQKNDLISRLESAIDEPKKVDNYMKLLGY